MSQSPAFAALGDELDDDDDRAWVAAAARARRPRVPMTAIIAAIALGSLAVCFAVAAWLVLAHRGPHRHPRPVSPPVAGAYLTGGAPTREPALEQLLTGPLIDYLVDGDVVRHGGGSEVLWQREALALRLAPAIALHGEPLVTEWNSMIDALDRFADEPVGAHGFHPAEATLRERVHAVSDRLAALGLGYYLAGAVVLDHRVAHAAVFVSRVDDVAFVEAGGDRRRVLALRRLDALNVTRPVLGMQGEELGDPVVLIDQIETFVANKVAPVAAGEPYPLGDESWRSTGLGARLAVVAGDAIRRELAGHLDPTRKLDPQLIALVIATVRRHEAEHGIDADRDPPLRAAPALARLGVDSGAASDQFALRARSELSGYVSQIANDPVVPQLALWNFASQAFHADRWGTAEAYAAVVAIEGLARYAGVTAPGPVVTGGRLDRGRLAQLALVLADLPDAALRSAARALWQDQFEARFEPIIDRDARLTP